MYLLMPVLVARGSLRKVTKIFPNWRIKKACEGAEGWGGGLQAVPSLPGNMKAPVYTLQFRPPEKLAALQHFRPETSKVLKRGPPSGRSVCMFRHRPDCHTSLRWLGSTITWCERK
jgi:hypothetical protein